MRKIFAILTSLVFSISGIAQLEFSGIEEIYASNLGLGSIHTLFGTLLWQANQEPVEIEYIQFTGTQYILLPIPLYRGYLFDGYFAMTQTTGDQIICGGRSGSGNRIYPLGVSSGKWWLAVNADNLYSSTATKDVVHVVADIRVAGNQTLEVDGENKVVNHNQSLVYPGRNPSCPVYLGCESVAQTARQKFAKFKLYSLKIYDRNMNLVLDLIPVRQGTTGYIYDSISGELFENLGTGNFILGPDKEVTE